jgi:lipoic acid synthetase
MRLHTLLSLESAALTSDTPHPESSTRHPDWIKARMTWTPKFSKTHGILKERQLVTVCEEAQCPNIGDCWSHQTATFMILGDTCTRRCTFCAVTQGNPMAQPPDITEPDRLADAALELGLDHVVITSVARDDLKDQGAGHFAACALALKRRRPDVKIEVLIPDFRGLEGPLRTVVDSPIDVLNHNTETVPRLYRTVRRGARYWRTLLLLRRAKQMRPTLPVKTGLMLGLGERPDEVREVLLDLREAGVDILTLGQYLQPSPDQHEVVRYLTPDEFEDWKLEALDMGFAHVESGPLVRSSYHAWEHVAKLA